jgi:hypothetical protein
MFRKWLGSALVIACAGFSVAALATTPDEASVTQHSYVADWRVTIGTEGHVIAMEPHVRKPSKAVRDAMEPDIRQWKFRPGMIDGKPVETTTLLVVTFSLVLDATGENYGLRYDEAHTGGSIASMSATPHFPSSEARRLLKTGGAELVAVIVTYNARGKATEVVVADDSPITEGVLAKAAIQEVRTWKYEPERIGGLGVAGRVLIPLCYAADRRTRCVWNRSAGMPEVKQGQSLALDSQVHLESHVVGRVL